MFVSGVSVRYCNNVLIVVVDLEMRNQLNQTNLSIYIETLDRRALAGKRAVLHNTAFVLAWRHQCSSLIPHLSCLFPVHYVNVETTHNLPVYFIEVPVEIFW